MTRTRVLVGIASSFLGLLLYVVGIATVDWLTIYNSQQGEVWHLGLWQFCLSTKGQTACIQYPDIGKLPSAFHATRFFAVIGVLLLIPGFAKACIAGKKNSVKGQKIGGALIIAAGLCGAMAAAIYTGDNISDPEFGHSFILTWVQTVFTVGGGAAIAYAGRREASQDETPVLENYHHL